MNKVLTSASLLLGSLACFGVVKYQQLKNAMSKLETKIESIKDLKIKSGVASFNLSVSLNNVTETDIYINGVIFKITRIFVYDLTGKKIGEATTDLSEIDIPNNKSLTINNIPVTIAVNEALSLLFSSGANLKENMQIKAQIEALGYTFII
ncbi:hypothetical protein SAMN05216480_1239 [Pustulibacterium marinum]|uniref:Late embryogenesis abundant protein n=1 Tax=Pustulibacterium marinum TaxID=1224947 RepID=A0A1I7IVT4_9FLAO|nr:hypothetical protein [Pustulibacterium marinum]SFU77043.1 hypothetical protein SAMN05216480_1239 [Pustulibacterium marinum]